MITASYAMRREGTMTSGFVRSRNVVRRERAKLGPVSFSVVVGILVLIVGLIYVNAGVRATSYDYELARLNDEMAEMESERESLAVENTRLQADAANADKNEVAVNSMVDIRTSGSAAL